MNIKKQILNLIHIQNLQCKLFKSQRILLFHLTSDLWFISTQKEALFASNSVDRVVKKVKFDFLAIWIGLYVFVLLFNRGTLEFYFKKPLRTEDQITGAGDDLLNTIKDRNTTYLELFNYNLLTSERKSNELFTRSTIMLLSGLIMAFVGIAVF